jgi:hypothetical protein
MMKNRMELSRAKLIAKTLGVRNAAVYLRRRGWSIESALYILVGAAAR